MDVNPAIHFNHQCGSMAIKIHNSTQDDLLTPEMKSTQLISPKLSP